MRRLIDNPKGTLPDHLIDAVEYLWVDNFLFGALFRGGSHLSSELPVELVNMVWPGVPLLAVNGFSMYRLNFFGLAVILAHQRLWFFLALKVDFVLERESVQCHQELAVN